MGLERTEILIVGGGIAGLAIARHLAEAGQRDVVLLDREDLPGFYSSGHNAGIARQLTGCAEHTALTIEGRDRLATCGLLDARGGLLLGMDPGGTDALALEARSFGLVAEQGRGALLPDLRAAEHLHVPSDGVLDVDGLLHHCAEGTRANGARIYFGCEVQNIHSGAAGFEVATDRGVFYASHLVNAAGGWAQSVGRMAGGLDIGFRPLRRHLVWSPAPYPERLPWTWWADRPLYLRPESGGLLMCACEEQLVHLPTRHTQMENDDGILDNLGASLRELAPTLANPPIARLWCGIRTFAPDRRFVIGWDPVNPRLFWLAGLGGHGMTSGLAVGHLAAEILLGKASATALAPQRFAQ